MHLHYFKIMRILKYLFLSLSILITDNSFSQSLIELQSNYSGSNSLSMNPALITTSYVYTDISIANFGLSVFNDYAYIKGDDLRTLIYSEKHTLPTYLIHDKEMNFAIYDNSSHKPKNLYESIDLNLLRFMLNIDEKQSLGFSLNGRVYTNATNIPWEIPEICTFGVEDSTYHNHYSSTDARIATMEWMEVAFSYSRKLYERYIHRFDAGITVKYLIGYSAASGIINDLDYEISTTEDENGEKEELIEINRFNADLAYSLPINYDESIYSKSVFNNSLSRGNGIGLDIGFLYTHRKNSVTNKKRITSPCQQAKIRYQWRIGISLMDLGFINFKKNAVDNYFDYNGSTLFNISDYNDIEHFGQMIEMMSETYYGDTETSRVGNSFKMGLPTTLRLQFDYNILNNFYVNATFIQPVRLLKYSVEATPQILVEPRYESNYFDFSIPLSFRNYKHFCIGAAARFGFISIGTQNLASYFGFGKVNGMDLFVSLKFNLIKGNCAEDRFDACWSADFGNKKRKR